MASLGFTGCLSVVRFNGLSPLKAALLHADTSPVVVSGPLLRSSCGSSAAARPSATGSPLHLPGRARLPLTPSSTRVSIRCQGASG